MAVLHEFVPNQGDAWTATLERLAEYYAASIEGRGEESPDPVFARALAATEAHEAARLGTLHRASPPGARLRPARPSPGARAHHPPGTWRPGGRLCWRSSARTDAALAAGLPELQLAVRESAERVVADSARLGDELRALDALTARGVS